ncbi:MAG: hypothetical protein PHS14_18080 [Elusimicrobia bacterium]|nr:hypothetical protein [Elusimicrobiota bacterium]
MTQIYRQQQDTFQNWNSSGIGVPAISYTANAVGATSYTASNLVTAAKA